MEPVVAALTPLEIASGIVGGESVVTGPLASGATDPAAALEAAVRAGLDHSPCLISFSGGYDSSVVLAAAVRVARRDGLALPVPITWRFPRAPLTDESAWQEAVIRELGVAEWERPHATDEFDLIGPLSMGVLRRHGLLFPANAFLHLPLLERARGGSLLTGVGGDQVLAHWRWQALADARAHRRRPVPRDGVRLALSRSPASLISLRDRNRFPPSPWLRAGAERRVRGAVARERAGEPSRWDDWVRWQRRRRDLCLSLASLEVLAASAGARVFNPLLDPRFLAALAQAGGRDGFGNRRAALAATVGDLVPRALQTRGRKARFDEVFWTGRARELAQAWDGSGVDPEIVDAAALRRTWLSPRSEGRTALLLQQVALDTGVSGPGGGRAGGPDAALLTS